MSNKKYKSSSDLYSKSKTQIIRRDLRFKINAKTKTQIYVFRLKYKYLKFCHLKKFWMFYKLII